MTITDLLAAAYYQTFNEQPVLIVRAPGRINLIGEHTDYNGGWVLPAAINRYISIAIGKRNDDLVRIYSGAMREESSCPISNIRPKAHHWSNYLLGIVAGLVRQNKVLSSFNMFIESDIPFGIGISSSAGLECAAALALNNLFDLDLSKWEIVQLAQAAEHNYAGVRCGIMDQFASMFGKKDKAVMLDCFTLEHQYIPLHLAGYKFVLFDIGIRHSLSSSQYNIRRLQCEEGVKRIQKYLPNIKTLREANLPMTYEYIADPLIRKRCEYVVKENIRVLSACDDLRNGDLKAFGKKMKSTHESLSKEYEVSCEELDFLVRSVVSNPHVLGARMMGAGFGGCTINIIREEAVEEVIAATGELYYNRTKKELKAFAVDIVDGAEELVHDTAGVCAYDGSTLE